MTPQEVIARAILSKWMEKIDDATVRVGPPVMADAIVCALKEAGFDVLPSLAMEVTDGDGGPFFRCYGLREGDTLTALDVADIQKVLSDHNEELGKSADNFHEGRMAAFEEIGGAELVKAVEANDDDVVRGAVAKALSRFEQKRRAAP